MIKTNKYLLLILIASFWAIIIFYLLQLDAQTYKFPDSYSYITSVEQLYYKNTLNDHRPFLFTLINGLPLIFKMPISSVYIWSTIINSISWLGSILILYSILCNLKKDKNAFIFTLLYVFSISSLLIVFHLMTEPIFTFALLSIFYFFQKFENTKSKKYLAFAFTLLILSLLIKPILKYFILIAIFVYIKDFIVLMKSKFSIFIFFSFSLLFFQMFCLNKKYGDFVISYIDTITYYNYLGTKADCYKKNIEFVQGKNQRHLYYSKLSPKSTRIVAIDDFKEQIQDNKLNLVKAYCSNLFINSTKSSPSVFACHNVKKKRYFESILYLFKVQAKIANIIFTIIGLIMSFLVLLKWKKSNRLAKIITIAILYIFFISGISTDQGDRLHMIFFPLVIILFYKKRAFLTP